MPQRAWPIRPCSSVSGSSTARRADHRRVRPVSSGAAFGRAVSKAGANRAATKPMAISPAMER
ncbi:hypothetical protein MPOCJGCO_2780 [Methylobacterium trifolii]|uniref:Uncharacterized protein n=1 Tax=Methylobacterium trifolii TaxID=1003092 RepID=A0ABQ4U1L6_9HYPH|nr:hypothetical protein MPOCJGCO_2780 [Methylobacterium trifolii]